MELLEEQTRNLNLAKIETPNNEPTPARFEYYTKGQNSPNVEEEFVTQAAAPHALPTISFVPYYITVVEESQLVNEKAELSRSEKTLLADYAKREGIRDFEGMMDSSSSGNSGGEKYEASAAKHGDKLFQKFHKKLSLYPGQCLR